MPRQQRAALHDLPAWRVDPLPDSGVPLPLVDGERTAVKRKPVRVWYAGSGDLTEDERRRIYQWLRDQGVFE